MELNESAQRRLRTRLVPGVGAALIFCASLTAGPLTGGSLTGELATALPELGQQQSEETVSQEGAADPEERGDIEGTESEPEDQEEDREVVDGDPQSRVPLWRLNTNRGNRAELEFPSGKRGQPRVAMKDARTGISWHIRLSLGPFDVTGRTGYRVQFRARSDFPRTLSVGLARLRPPYGYLSSVQGIDTTPLWSRYEVALIADEDSDVASLMFNVGGNRYAVEISDLVIIRNSDGQVVAEGPQGQLAPEGASGTAQPEAGEPAEPGMTPTEEGSAPEEPGSPATSIEKGP